MGLAPGQAGGYEQDGEGGIIPLEAEVQDSGLARETPRVIGGRRARVLASPRTFEGRGQRTTVKVPGSPLLPESLKLWCLHAYAPT